MARKKAGRTRVVTRARRAGGELLEMGQQVWLAGVGALALTQKRGPKLFEELVSEGSRVLGRASSAAESSTKDALKELRRTFDKGIETARGQASATWDQVGRMFETRVHRAMRQLGMPTSDEIVALTRKVKELNAAVGELARRSGPRKQRKASAVRRARRPHGNGSSVRSRAAVHPATVI